MIGPKTILKICGAGYGWVFTNALVGGSGFHITAAFSGNFWTSLKVGTAALIAWNAIIGKYFLYDHLDDTMKALGLASTDAHTSSKELSDTVE